MSGQQSAGSLDHLLLLLSSYQHRTDFLRYPCLGPIDSSLMSTDLDVPCYKSLYGTHLIAGRKMNSGTIERHVKVLL